MTKQVSTTIKRTEIEREIVLNRFPPGDRWFEPDNPTLVFDTLTDGLQHIFQTKGHVEFFISAKRGVVEVLDIGESEEELVLDVPEEPKPEPKKYSLYDE